MDMAPNSKHSSFLVILQKSTGSVTMNQVHQKMSSFQKEHPPPHIKFGERRNQYNQSLECDFPPTVGVTLISNLEFAVYLHSFVKTSWNNLSQLVGVRLPKGDSCGGCFRWALWKQRECATKSNVHNTKSLHPLIINMGVF